MRNPRGTTLLELCVVMVIAAMLAALAVPRLSLATDRARVRAAVQEAGSLYSLGRRSAIARRALVAVVVDTVGGSVTVRAGARQIARVAIGDRYGVRLQVSRDSMSYDPRGLGFGVANLSLIARRGRAAETLSVSRLGRARH
jgi:prepilin-type N-terminal cleavage/methylation domain-containing protein